MRTPLRYQATCFDCGPTSLVNALLFLFDRHEVPLCAVRFIEAATCDRYLGDGEGLCGGTSAAAMGHVAAWLNDHARRCGLPLACEHLTGDAVTMRGGGALDRALADGAVVVAGVCLGADHYVLLTGLDGGWPARTGVPGGTCGPEHPTPQAGAPPETHPADGRGGAYDRVLVFDPYYDTWPLHELDVPVVGVEPDCGHPFSHNRIVQRWVFDAPAGTPYSLAQKTVREAMVLTRTDRRH